MLYGRLEMLNCIVVLSLFVQDAPEGQVRVRQLIIDLEGTQEVLFGLEYLLIVSAVDFSELDEAAHVVRVDLVGLEQRFDAILSQTAFHAG